MNFLKNKWWLIVILLLAVGGFSAYKYAYKPHVTTESLSASFKGDASNFLTKVSSNSDEWLNKAVVLSGKITSIDSEGVVLNGQIFCQFNREEKVTAKVNDEIIVKGVVIGYDDLLEELKINNCILKNN